MKFDKAFSRELVQRFHMAKRIALRQGPDDSKSTRLAPRPRAKRHAGTQCLLVGGVEGAGKTTLIQLGKLGEMFPGVRDIQSQRRAEQSIRQGHSVVVETELSNGRMREVIERTKARSAFIYIFLDSPMTALKRMGKDGANEDFRMRWFRSIGSVRWHVLHAEQFWLFDNTSSKVGQSPHLLAHGSNGRLRSFDKGFNPWADIALMDFWMK